jgi:hypothetical protein
MSLSIRGINVAEKIFDGPILHLGVFDGDRALKNTDLLRILIENSLDVFCCPERILQNKVW